MAAVNRINGLIGLFVHTFKDGRVCYQGQIISTHGEFALVQLFEWLAGEPSIVKAIPICHILSSDAILYTNADQMNANYQNHCEQWERDDVTPDVINTKVT